MKPCPWLAVAHLGNYCGQGPVAALVLLLLLGWFGFEAPVPPEPVYRGKPLTLWLQIYSPSSVSGRGTQPWNEADDCSAADWN